MRIQNCGAHTANINEEFSVVRSSYIKKEEIHGSRAGKQEMHIGLRVGNANRKTLGRRRRRRNFFICLKTSELSGLHGSEH